MPYYSGKLDLLRQARRMNFWPIFLFVTVLASVVIGSKDNLRPAKS